ncbi:hypothetical protein AFM18_08460 [Achromobacter spanius]|uniref:Uncharacterized protein n=2 Tax=Achromobacter spanius TaxID=217203 RepID=A0AAW3I8F7_9BURK|nr:hypothetical protein AFM18_08460 [Achromobacter spanius]
MTTNNAWVRLKDQVPTEAGMYEWRVPSSTVPGMVLIVAAKMRMRGAGGTDVLSPEFDYWDGYRVLVQCEVEWRPTAFVPGKYQRTPAVLGIEGLEISPCSRCGKVPGITAHQVHPHGGVICNPVPWQLNSWKFVCCAWGETPTLNNPLEIERIRRETRGRAAPDLLEALEIMLIGACAVGVPHAGERKVLQDAVDHARATINKAKGEQQ